MNHETNRRRSHSDPLAS